MINNRDDLPDVSITDSDPDHKDLEDQKAVERDWDELIKKIAKIPLGRRAGRWLKRTALARNTTGRILAGAKNLAAKIFPVARVFDIATDSITKLMKGKPVMETLKNALLRAVKFKGGDGSLIKMTDADGKFSFNMVLASVLRVVVISIGLILIYWIGGALGLPVEKIVDQLMGIFGSGSDAALVGIWIMAGMPL